jgi:prepilin-type N-terminal cleavage/methylation domain-containing protein
MKSCTKSRLHDCRGFGLIETLIAVVVAGIIITGLVVGIGQLSRIPRDNSNKITLVRNLDIAGNWFIRDFESAYIAPVSATLSPGVSTLEITQSVNNRMDTPISYHINPGGELIRTGGGANSIIAANITSVNYSTSTPATLEISSSAGSATLTRTYQVPSRIYPTIYPLSIDTISLAEGDVGFVYTQTLAASGGLLPYSWTVPPGSLPAWALLNSSTGTISGGPTVGTTSFTVTVTDSSSPALTDARDLSITINLALVINTSSPLPEGVVNIAYDQTLENRRIGPVRLVYTVGNLPNG